ncbi:inner membrane-spanning protein YciB [Sphingomonas jatrophae]|uniref:Inner membrane-spanning protein YciB n=1 Tax=Sphingomonas jatrophae TaxID=1166337 RepID=A0A1I6JYJ0_9SPHN|nr:inner membrane-spanning protein YciB [Sphingomonas jatrophae]SFR84032.1 intracellular septation protein [Sphingomonas jatrophae]
MTSQANPRPEPSPLLKLALDLGPLIIFFGAYAILKDVYIATGLFMAATAVAMIASRLTHGRVSPMLWFSGAMVLLMGGATLWLRDETFIKVKPTLYYLVVAGILAFGLWSGRPTLKLVLGAAYPGLTERGWTLLTRNWAIFFVVLAVANEAVWRNTTTSLWLGYKLWGALPATLLFAVANVPMLLRHGLTSTAGEPDAPPSS